MEQIEQSLVNAVNKVGDAAPHIMEKIVSSYTEVNAISSVVDMYTLSFGSFLFIGAAIVSFFKDDGYGGGVILGSLSILVSFLCLWGATTSYAISKAPQAYAIKSLTDSALEK